MARQAISYAGKLLQTCRLSSEDDLVEARAAVKMHAADSGFSILNQTKIVTAVSELGRNVIEHGLGGSMQIDRVSKDESIGLRVTFKDNGPGIPDIQLALTDGFSSRKGMGLGLTGSKRLMDEFDLESRQDVGTTVVIVKWK